MNYFNQILGGNVPLLVLQNIRGFNYNHELVKQTGHYQINEHLTNDFDNQFILDSNQSAPVKASLNLDRNKVGLGLFTIINKAFSSLNNVSLNLSDENINDLGNKIGESIINVINQLSMDDQLKEEFVNFTHLTGITNKNKKEIDEIKKQTMLLLELHKSFKINKRIDMFNSLKNVLSSQIVQSCNNNLKCIFNDDFMFKVSYAWLLSLEHILGTIMNSLKHDKVCSLYAFSVSLAEQLSKLNSNVVENFGVSAGNSTKLTTSTKINDLKTIDKNIDQSKVISGLSKIISDVVNNVVSANTADLLRTIAASNKININSAKGTNFDLRNVTQTTTIDTTVQSEFAQSITTNIQNEIASKIKDTINNTTKEYSKNINKSVNDQNLSTTLGDTIGKVMDTVGEILSVSVGNSMEQTQTQDVNQEMKDLFSLNQSFNYQKTDDVKNAIENILSTDNLAKCAANSSAANEINLGSINMTGEITIDNIKQENVVKDVMNCAFNQTVLNDISTKVFNDFDRLITSMIENVDDNLTTEQKTTVQGDIYAIGVAGSAVLESTGKAVKDVGAGVSVAAEGLGSGLATAAEGVGKGISGILSGLMAPLIIAGVVLLLLIIGYVLFKTMGSSGGDSYDNGSYDNGSYDNGSNDEGFFNYSDDGGFIGNSSSGAPSYNSSANPLDQ
jgi:hypothetical protein